MYDFLGPPPKRNVGARNQRQQPVNPYDYLGPPLTPQGLPRYEFLQDERGPDPVSPVPQDAADFYSFSAPAPEATPKIMGLLDPELTRAVLSGRPQIDGVLGRDAMGLSPERIAQLRALQQRQLQWIHSPAATPVAYTRSRSDESSEGSATSHSGGSDLAFARANDNIWGPVGDPSFGYKIKRAGVKSNANIRNNFNTIVQSISGKAFNPNEMGMISNEILDNIGFGEAALFRDVLPSRDGILRLNEKQWNVIQGLISSFPQDDLGKRVRNAYDDAVKNRRIRLEVQKPRR